MRYDETLRLIGEAADKLGDYPPGVNIDTFLKGAEGLASAFDCFKVLNGGSAPAEAEATRNGRLAGDLAMAAARRKPK